MISSAPLSLTSLIFIFEQLLRGLWPAQSGHVLSLLLQTQQEAEGNDASFKVEHYTVLHNTVQACNEILNLCFSNPTVLCSCKEENCVLYLWRQKETSQCCVFDRLLCCKFSSPTVYFAFKGSET